MLRALKTALVAMATGVAIASLMAGSALALPAPPPGYKWIKDPDTGQFTLVLLANLPAENKTGDKGKDPSIDEETVV